MPKALGFTILKSCFIYMLLTLLHIIITIPLLEYGIHYALHSINNVKHKQHHIEYFNHENTVERYLLVIIPPVYLLDYHLIALGLFQYWLVHTMIHFYPNFLPKMIVQHHITHHKYPDYNFAVSNPYIDSVFHTQKR